MVWNFDVIFLHAATNSNFLILTPVLLYFFLQTVHVIIGVTFLVTLAGFASFGNFVHHNLVYVQRDDVHL